MAGVFFFECIVNSLQHLALQAILLRSLAKEQTAKAESPQVTAASMLSAFATIRLHVIMRHAAASGYWEQSRFGTRMPRALRIAVRVPCRRQVSWCEPTSYLLLATHCVVDVS